MRVFLTHCSNSFSALTRIIETSVGQAEEDHVQLNDAVDALRESGDVENILTRDSWEEEMVAKCRSRLAVRPHSSRAVLFYSQNPDGTPDSSSKVRCFERICQATRPFLRVNSWVSMADAQLSTARSGLQISGCGMRPGAVSTTCSLLRMLCIIYLTSSSCTRA